MIDFRNATKSEIATILEWAAAEGWNPGLEDAAAFYNADPQGFFVATQQDNPIAAISVVNHNRTFAFLGLYIVLPAFRGKGIGYDLWKFALDHAGPRIVALDGVPEQQANYTASGFESAGATVRFEGSIAPKNAASIRLAETSDVSALVTKEAAASGVHKPAYLTAWMLNTPSRKTFICKDSGAFCTARSCQNGTKIGPLLAKSPQDAQALMQHVAHVFGPDIVIDVPGSASQLTELCNAFAMKPSFETARMYRGSFSYQPLDLFAAATLELG